MSGQRSAKPKSGKAKLAAQETKKPRVKPDQNHLDSGNQNPGNLDPKLTNDLDRLLSQLVTLIEVIYVRRPLEGLLGSSEDLTAAQLRTLRLLSSQATQSPGLLVGAISEGLRISYPAASKAVDRLTDRGLAERQRDIRDARQTLVRLTERGQDVVSRVAELRRAQLNQVLLRLGGEQPTKALIGLLEAFQSASLDRQSLEAHWLEEIEREAGQLV